MTPVGRVKFQTDMMVRQLCSYSLTAFIIPFLDGTCGELSLVMLLVSRTVPSLDMVSIQLNTLILLYIDFIMFS